MVTSIWDDIKRAFSRGDNLTRLIIVNIGFFLFIHIVGFLMVPFTGIGNHAAFNAFLEWFMAPSDPVELLKRPWTIITYMFLHEGIWHLVFNMLFLYWFGRIVQDLLGDHRILPIYLLGGLAGFVAFFISANFLPGNISYYIGSHMLGASAGVMAIVMAAATLAPTYIMHLLLIGPVQIRYIALFLIVIDMIAIREGSNTGGHFAHLGGVAMGWYFIHALRNGTDLSRPVNNLLERIATFFRELFAGRRRSHIRVRHANKKPSSASAKKQNGLSPDDPAYQRKLDRILDKIRDRGYESLTREEKEFLFRASKK